MKISSIVVATAVLLLPALAPAEELKGEGLAMLSSLSNNFESFAVASENLARTGLTEVNYHRRQSMTVVAFDLDRNPEVREQFTKAKALTLSFELIGVTNANASMPPLNVEFIGTFEAKNLHKEFWTVPALATWENVAQSTSTPQVFQLSTANLASGKVALDESARQYAVFRFRMADPAYNDSANRNYSLKAEAKAFSLATDVQP